MSDTPHRRPLTRLAHERLAAVLSNGDFAVDATVGNGHDTLFLAEQVGDNGHVWGFDVQAEALAVTTAELAERQLTDRVTLLKRGHQEMHACLPAEAHGRLSAVVFNLGYLPGSDKQVTTGPETTLQALDAGIANLGPGGLLSILAYRGHPGGQVEADAVAQWLASLTAVDFAVETFESPGPVLHLVTRS